MSSNGKEAICIGCLSNENLLNTFKPISKKVTLSYNSLLESCFYITIRPDDALSYMCKECTNKLIDAFNFKNQVVQSMKVLVDRKFQSDTNSHFVNSRIDPISLGIPYILSNGRATLNRITKIVIHSREDKIKTEDKSDNVFIKRPKNEHDNFCDYNDESSNPSETDTAIEIEKVKKSKQNTRPRKINHTTRKINIKTKSKRKILNEEEYNEYVENKKIRKKRSYKPTPLPFVIDENTTTCPVCNAEHTNSRMLRIHMNKHYSNYVCDKCGKGFVSKTSLKIHENIHEEGPFKCDSCDKIFERKNTLLSHQKAKHGTGRFYPCKVCKEKFTTIHSLISHKESAHGVIQKLICTYCGKSFSLTSELNRHIKCVHLMVKDKECPHCDKRFFRSETVKCHMIYAHNIGERKYSCNYCQKRFVTRYNLKVHSKTHYKGM